jgi:hypothetical protein
MQVPCDNCPWRKNSKPGYLGGSHPLTYIGQAQGPFVLPCHKACNFEDPGWRAKTISTRQCAGAAIYRANVGVAYRLPGTIHHLPPSKEVFGSPEEFLSHHTKISIAEAQSILRRNPPESLFEEELSRVEVMSFAVPK